MQRYLLGSAEGLAFSPSRLRDARLKTGLHQREVAEALGCLVDILRRWESGRTSPSAELLLKLMIIYDVNPRDLMRTG
ncbi:helix-turn-helix domain-containing protein [bacterium]|nr:helix-turn-helix domain-containing protein [bacterium]